MSTFDHVLMVGFGGPTRPEEVRPFLKQMAQGARIPEARLKEVEHHYEMTGGFSQYNMHAIRLFEKIKACLARAGVNLPCFLGMRNWHPFLTEPLKQIRDAGLCRGLGIVLAPHRSEASFDRYVKSVEEAKHAVGALELDIEYMGPWYDHPFFAQAQADRVRQVWTHHGEPDWKATQILFTAHSIPVEIARACRYEQEIQISAARTAAELGGYEWSVAYQSRSGPPSEAWLEPDILSVLPGLAKKGKHHVVVTPIGFLFDHTEVLYDLDIEARRAAKAAGLEFMRASTVMDHPKFVGMLSGMIERWP